MGLLLTGLGPKNCVGQFGETKMEEPISDSQGQMLTRSSTFWFLQNAHLLILPNDDLNSHNWDGLPS